ncbi:glycoside hydrolase family 18 [Fusarium albosuccineum]|uniref:Glycoside hydrolase family 18 n=1 Tax=Fusarium albosuccineum TaxID=1237068 RepID=A0A8H4KZB1_9HYPO|nr:glycoside hydrolase family 18 [Fusarium albosuccineum]
MRFGTAYLLASVFLPGTLAGVIDDRQSGYEVPCGDRPLLPGETCCDTPDGKKNICGYGFFGCCNFGHVCRVDGECVPVSDGGPPSDPTTIGGGSPPTSTENGAPPPGTTEGGNPVPTTDENGDPVTTDQGETPPPNTTDQNGNPNPTTNENGDHPTTNEEGNPVPTTDEEGNPIPTTNQGEDPPPATTDQTGIPIPTTDENGNPNPTTDEQGNPVPTTDENGDPVPTTDQGGSPPPNTTDEEGNPIPTTTEGIPPPNTTDENGNPAPTTNEGADPSPTTDEEGSPPPTTEEPGNNPTVTDGPLVTQTEWPPLTIIPVETEVPESDEDDGDPVFPCAAWFFFICIRWDGGPIIGGWRWILPPGIYTSGPPNDIEWPEGVRIEGSLPPWPKITIGNDHKPTYEDEPTSCETKSATIHVTTTSYGVSISGTVTSTTTSRVLETSNVILGCDVEDDEATETQTEVTSTSEAPDVFTDVGEWAAPLPTDDLASTGPEAASMFSEIDAYYSCQYLFHFGSVQTLSSANLIKYKLTLEIQTALEAEELSTTMSTVLSESTSTDFPTLTGEPTTDPTTIPIETSEGSSCVTTITTSVCQIPGQPCSPSLSCESWTATATTSDTPTESSEPPEPSYSWSATFYRNKCEEDITDYYSVGGYAEQGPDTACVRLKDPDVPEHDDFREYCRFFTDGGDEHGPCSEATFDEVQSWVIRDGFCTVYETEDCTHDGVWGGIDSDGDVGCTDKVPSRIVPKNWRSMSCFAMPPRD